MVVGAGGEIMPGCGWLWVVATKLWLVVGGQGWSWMVTQFSNAPIVFIEDTCFVCF